MAQQTEFQREQIIDAWALVGRTWGMAVANIVLGQNCIAADVLTDRQLLNCKEAATYIGKGVTTFRELRDSGTITEHRETPSAKPKFFKADLDRYLATLKRKG